MIRERHPIPSAQFAIGGFASGGPRRRGWGYCCAQVSGQNGCEEGRGYFGRRLAHDVIHREGLFYAWIQSEQKIL